MTKIALIGIGNPFRGDDGAGWKVIDTLQNDLPKEITLCKVQADPAPLLDLFSTHSVVIIVDATENRDLKNGWQRFDITHNNPLAKEKTTSTHGLTLETAIELARTLGQLPSKLIVYVISGEDFSPSDHLTSPVRAKLPHLIQALKKEIETCMNKA